MADFLKTITNSVNLFGGEAATKWGSALGAPYTMVWGTTKWGEGTYTIIINIGKTVRESTTISEAHFKSVGFQRTITALVVPADNISIERLSLGIWNYVFTSDTTNASDRTQASYVSGAGHTATFTCQAAGSTTWTEV